MTTTAIIDTAGFVQDMILAHHEEVDPQALGHPVGWTAIDGEGGAFGDTWDGSQWLKPDPADTPQPVPESVTMRAARRAMLDAGLLSQVGQAIAGMPSPDRERAMVDWEYAQTVERYSPFVASLAPVLGLSDAQLDQLFLAAATMPP